ncbi:DUF2142 domain-containing protein [Kozakia baliensis]|uniref:DUF2142 domain-containing protein n=1 Tax=Kozakia baliensis TaxID=153496 RepID=UPI00345B5C48
MFKKSAPASRVWAAIFLPFALLMVMISALANPPFQVLDEAAHFLRAVQVSQGGLRGVKQEGQSGGYVPANLLPLLHGWDDLRYHPERKASLANIEKADTIKWGGNLALIGFPNTVTYGPFCYLPQTFAVLLGRFAHLSIIRTYYLAKIVNGLFFALVATLSIAIARRGDMFLLLICALPMTFDLAASLSQDGPLIALNAWLAALLTRHERNRPWSWAAWGMMGLGFGAAGMAKPPELALSLIAYCVAGPREQGRALICPVIAAILTLVWLIVGVMPIKLQFLPGSGVSDHGQLLYLWHHPFALPILIVRSIATYGTGYYEQFIGVLGWLDTPLPAWFYGAAFVIFVAALLMSLGRDRHQASSVAAFWWKLGIAASILSATAGVFLSLYVIWTPVGAPLIHGVHGRYFLPIACFVILLFPDRSHFTEATGSVTMRRATTYLLTMWLFVTVAVFSHTLIMRFWAV